METALGLPSPDPWGQFQQPDPQESPSHLPHRPLRLQVPRTRAARCLVVKRFSLLVILSAVLKV